MIWVQFAATALVIVLAGVRLARYGDVLGEKSGPGSELDRRRPARRDDEPSGAVHRLRRDGTRRAARHRAGRCARQLHVQPRSSCR